jgi:hypothetical protein
MKLATAHKVDLKPVTDYNDSNAVLQIGSRIPVPKCYGHRIDMFSMKNALSLVFGRSGFAESLGC